MNKVQKLRLLVEQRLTAAAEEIFVLFERTIAEYEEEICRKKEENDKRQQLLDDVWIQKVPFHTAECPADIHQVTLEQQSQSPSLDQKDPSQMIEELKTNQEDDATRFLSTAVPVKSKNEDAQSSQLHQSQTDDQSEDTEDSDDWTDSSELELDLNKKMAAEADGEGFGHPEVDTNRVHIKYLQSRAVQCRQSKRRRPFDKQSCVNEHVNTNTGCGTTISLENLTEVTITPRDGNDSIGSDVGQKRKRHPCSMCGKTFDRNSWLEIHMRTHTGEKPYSCSVCQRHFRQKGALQTHMLIHTKEKPFDCYICGKKFTRKRILRCHMIVHQREKPLSSSFFQHADLIRFPYNHGPVKSEDGEVSACPADVHQLSVNKVEVPPEQQDQGPSLDQENPEPPPNKEEHVEVGISQGVEEDDLATFPSTGVPVKSEDEEEETQPSQLHQRQTEENREACGGSDMGNKWKTYNCFVCGKIFSRKADFQRHERMHTGEKPYGCSACGKKFADRSNLRNHMIIHTLQKPFSCSVCQKSFRQKGALRGHMLIHTGEKPFDCLQCGKKFTQKATLFRHFQLHTGEKPFSCSVCQKSFHRKYQLQSHMTIH